MQGLFQAENIDILSCNLTGIKPRYDSTLNEVSGFFFLYLNTASKCEVCSFASGVQCFLPPLLPIFFYSLLVLYLNDLYLFAFFPLLSILIPFYKS